MFGYERYEEFLNIFVKYYFFLACRWLLELSRHNNNNGLGVLASSEACTSSYNIQSTGHAGHDEIHETFFYFFLS